MSDPNTPSGDMPNRDTSREDSAPNDLFDLAAIFALDAISPAERDSIERRRATAIKSVRDEFDQRVRDAREAMASVSTTTAVAPPTELRERILRAADATTDTNPTDAAATTTTDAIAAADSTVTDFPRPDHPTPSHTPNRALGRTNRAYLVAAAVAAIAIGAVGWAIGSSVSGDRDPSPPPTAEQVFSAKDVRSSSGAVASGQATVTYSDSADAGVLVMNDVPPPQPGTVYQMWLVGPDGPTSAGTMTDKDVAPSTTAVLPHLGDASALAFSVEPPGGSPAPTGPFVAKIPLS